MNETDLFNRDVMYWREVNFYLPTNLAEIALITSLDIGVDNEIEFVDKIHCHLLSYETHTVEYDLDNGGSFTKNEVKSWPFILDKDIDFYNDQSNGEDARNAKIKSLLHENIKSITIKDKAGNIVLKKEKV